MMPLIGASCSVIQVDQFIDMGCRDLASSVILRDVDQCHPSGIGWHRGMCRQDASNIFSVLMEEDSVVVRYRSSYLLHIICIRRDS